MTTEFNLRDMQPSDASALSQLLTEVSMSGLTTYFGIDPYLALTASDVNEIKGVVVEQAEDGRIVGLATVTFGHLQVAGDLLPYAYLGNLKVHGDFRRKGLGARLAQWRVAQAEEAFGDQGVIMTGMETSNHASRATARKWCRDFIEPISVAIVPVKDRAPSKMKGVTVREAQPADFEEIVAKQNAFYQDYDLYEPITVDSLNRTLTYAPTGVPLFLYFVAVSTSGEILAGLRVKQRGMLMVDRLHNPPPPLRLMNLVLRMLPPDFTIRDLGVTNLWFLPDQGLVAQYFWQMVRWFCRKHGTTLGVTYDPRSNISDVLQLKPWHQPRPELAFAIRASNPLHKERKIGICRVR